jgi:RNA polymerase sigma factor (sigma-70 family)
VDVGTPDLTVSHQPGSAAPSKAPEPVDAVNRQVVAGGIPAEPPGFRPRPGLLAELDSSGARVAVIHSATGLPGSGTTELAAAYARAKLEAGWPLVAWVNGVDAASLLVGLAAVADAAGLIYDDSGPGITDAAAAVRLWLETDGDDCLLVFDNVSDPELLRDFIPDRGAAQVLVTTTRQSPANLGTGVPVDVLSAAEASAFLASRSGLGDEAGAAPVAAALGHLPLALALAAPVIAGQHVGYASYLDRLQAMANVSRAGDERSHPPALKRTVLLSLQAVRAADRTGVCTRVMELMSVLSAAGVRREVLYAAGQAGVLGSGRHRLAAGPVDHVLKWLSGRSLLTISLDGQTIMLHPAVARVIRNELDRRHMMTSVCEAAVFVLDVYSRALVGSQDRRAVREIPQQVTALLDSLARPATEVDEELAWLLLRLRFVAFYHLIELGDSTPLAIAVGEPLARDLERLLGPDHPDTLNSRNSLAAAYLAAGRVAEAIPLFEQTLAVRQRTLGPDDPETLTSRNNLASAYQDAGRTAEAIQLYELNLEVRERLLGADHTSTLTSRGNLAAAYQGAGQAAKAIPLFERTLADRERVLGPDHPDVQTSRKNLAKAYRNAGRDADAVPLLERTLADRKSVLRTEHRPAANWLSEPIPATKRTPRAEESQLPDALMGPGLPASFRRPPAGQALRALPAGLRRPPTDPVRQPLPSIVPRPVDKLTEHSTSRARDLPQNVQDDRGIVAAVAAEDPAGIAAMYDKYAADLYDYCHWMLPDLAEAADALKNTFVIAAVTLNELPEPAKLRPWLFALAHNEGRRRIRPTSVARDEQADPVGQPTDVTEEASDATITFRALGSPSDVTRKVPDRTGEASDATVTFPALASLSEVSGGASDATVTFPALASLSEVSGGASDATVTFRALGSPSDLTREASDLTMPSAMVGLPSDATMSFRVVSQPAHGVAHLHADRGEAALRTLIYSIMAGLKPRERELIELHFRHDLDGDDLAIALGVSWSRAHVLAARTRNRLEEALNALHIALTRRETCPVLGELLADWDGQLTKDTRNLVNWHIGECQTCAHRGWGALRPSAFSRLLPLAPLPPELRAQVLNCCTSKTEDAAAYRWRVVRRADSIWFTTFSPAIRRLNWSSIRAHPGAAIAAIAVALWVAAAASVALLTFAGSHTAYAQAAQPTARSVPSTYAPPTGAGASSGSPADTPSTIVRTSATARSSPSFTRPSVYVSSPVQPSPSPEVSKSSSPKPSTSPKPSKSSSPKPSTSASPKPSKSSSSGPSPSSSASPTP